VSKSSGTIERHPFLSGAVCASIVWISGIAVNYFWSSRYRRRRRPSNETAKKDEATDSTFLAHAITSRIGELPSRIKTRWPWDRVRPPSSADSFASDNPELKSPGRTNQPSDDASMSEHSDESPIADSSIEKGLCIGSIFGLDVGGTLAKLVYFEQETRDHVYEDHPSVRERHHHQAASAGVVLNARRGQDKEDIDKPFLPERQQTNKIHSSQSDNDLKVMYQTRQTSLPDNLNKFAQDCNFPTTQFSSTQSLRTIVLGEKGGDKDDSANKTKVEPNESNPPTAPDAETDDTIPLSPSTVQRMKRSRSMFDISKSRDHAEALNRFYNFARLLDSYETGVKDKHLSFYSRELGGHFHFIRFETRRMENAMDLIRVNNLHQNIVQMGATGGGAHKYAADWERVLAIKMVKQDEMDSLVAGMQFVMADVVGECYTFKPKLRSDDEKKDTPHGTDHSDSSRCSTPKSKSADSEEGSAPKGNKPKGDEWWWTRKVQRDVITDAVTYPYLLVTIGTGVSILRVDGPRKHERISGSTIGGGTYWGLCRLLTDVEDFEDVLNLAERGDPSKVDMMVGDIYGENSDALEKLGLPSHIVASSFGKLVAKQDPASGIKQEDLARALLLMVTINIGQVSYLNAQLHKTPRIYFVGNFLRHNSISQQRLAFAIDYWSKGKMEALFLEHEGNFGALGAFLLSQGISHSRQTKPTHHRSHTRSEFPTKPSSNDSSHPPRNRTKST